MVDLRRIRLLSFVALVSVLGGFVLQGINQNISAVLFALGATSFLAVFVWSGSSDNKDRWRKVRGTRKLGFQLIIIGGIVGSSGAITDLLFSKNTFAVPLILIGGTSFTLGVVAVVLSLAGTRKKPAGST